MYTWKMQSVGLAVSGVLAAFVGFSHAVLADTSCMLSELR
jgi:hypothetical protein